MHRATPAPISCGGPESGPIEHEEGRRSLEPSDGDRAAKHGIGKKLLIGLGVVAALAGFFGGVVLLMGSQPLEFTAEQARATPYGMIETDSRHPYAWAFIDEDGRQVDLEPCTQPDRNLLVASGYRCQSADGSTSFTFVYDKYDGVEKAVLHVPGVGDIPEHCAISSHTDWHAFRICMPVAALASDGGSDDGSE